MALKHLIILLPLLFASSALGKLKIYCTEEDAIAPKKDGGDKKDGGADKKDCPDPKKDGGGGDKKDGGGGDKKDCPDPKGDGGVAPKDGIFVPIPDSDGGVAPKDGGDKKDCPDPKNDGGVAPKDGGDKKDCPDPKGDGGVAPKDGIFVPIPNSDGGVAPNDKDAAGGDKKDCPDPKGDGGVAPKDGIFVPIPNSDGGVAPNDKDAAGGDKKDCPDPKGDGGVAPKDGGDKKDCPDPKGDGGVAPKDGIFVPIPNSDGGVAPKDGGDKKDCPDPKNDGGVAPKDGGDKKDCPDPKGDGGVAPKDGIFVPIPNSDGGVAPKDGGGDKKDCPDSKGDGGVAPKDKDATGGDKKDSPDPKGDGGVAPKDKDAANGIFVPIPDSDGGGAPKDKDAAGGGGGGDKKDAAGGDKKDAGGGGGDKKDAAGGDKKDDKKDAGGGGGGKDDSNKDKGGGGDKKKDDKKKDGTAPPCFDPPLYKQPILDSDYKGEWIVQNKNVGVNAMQHQLMPNNKAVWFDTTNLGPSARELGPKGNCPPNPDNNNEPDCFAHAVQYDVETGDVKSVYVETDPWCSSGHMLPTGDLLSTGGNKMGDKSVRLLKKDDPAPKFVERKNALGAGHWYASNCVLEDGSAVIVGGRDSYTYDLVPPSADFKPNNKNLPFLEKTTTPAAGPGLHVENNLYPFTYLLPDGNVFIFANDRAISFNPKSGETVKEYPVLQGGSRNYPPSGQSALLPIRLTADNKAETAEIVICGGNKPDAFQNVDPRYTQNRVFAPALADCNRIVATDANPVWQKEQDMPSPRVMGDLLQLPNAQFLLINGAKKGTSGWDDGEDPNLTPTVYMPENEMGKRFKELKPTNIPRMYHSSSSVLPDGKVLIAGSNAHQFYTYDGPYPTELRVEKFSPHYLDPKFEKDRPVITVDGTDKQLKYGKEFKVAFTIASNPKLADGDVIVTLLYPPFTTHGFSQNQRMLICSIKKLDKTTTVLAPPSGKVAPPGYYILYVNHRNIPSKGVWVQLGA